ncbi:RING-H2 finger protein ATL79-like [Typha angustifolia]|uniref:RING-H2 finger protein ATL79-like n=1 Tax=Typha angustifolia TaxID=59011 RepID=UPI003C2D61FF
MPVPYHEIPLFPPPPSPSHSTNQKWGPYSGPGDFGANIAVILAALFAAFALALALNAAIRYLLCRHRRRRSPSSDDLEKSTPAQEPAMVFSAGTKLAGAGAECAICLAEFADGDAVRVLPACNHGFHVRCIERWLAARSSCPTCRTSCHVAAAAPEKSGAGEA